MNSFFTVGGSHLKGAVWLLKWALWLALCGVSVSGCGRQNAPRLPPPVYQEPSLPHWEPPPEEDVAPFDLEGMEGEVVEDEEEVSDEGQGDAPTTPLSEGKPGEQTEADAETASGAESTSEADSKIEAGAE